MKISLFGDEFQGGVFYIQIITMPFVLMAMEWGSLRQKLLTQPRKGHYYRLSMISQSINCCLNLRLLHFRLSWTGTNLEGDVVVQSSVDGGTEWSTIKVETNTPFSNYFPSNWFFLQVIPRQTISPCDFELFTINIPRRAKSPFTSFRWWQPLQHPGEWLCSIIINSCIDSWNCRYHKDRVVPGWRHYRQSKHDE